MAGTGRQTFIVGLIGMLLGLVLVRLTVHVSSTTLKAIFGRPVAPLLQASRSILCMGVRMLDISMRRVIMGWKFSRA